MKQALSFALRDLRGGLTGLRLLAICLFLGVAGLAGVGSLTAAIGAAISEQGQSLLGGDVEYKILQREASAEEFAAFAETGRVSTVMRTRAMIARSDGNEALLGELKAVDSAYPLFGALKLAPGAIASRPGHGDVALAEALAARLRVKPGGRVRIGEAQFRIVGIIDQEPDRIGSGFTFGPTAIINIGDLAATQLIQPGSIYDMRYRIRLNKDLDPKTVIARINADFPQAGWEANDRSNGAPSTRRFVERMGQFLSLVGLTALIIAGIGVGNGVSSYLTSKRTSIATMKAMGADSRTIFLTYFLQILIISIGGIVAGLLLGGASPAIAIQFTGDALPMPDGFALYPIPLGVAALFGLFTTILFATIPLARAGKVRAASLFRGSLGLSEPLPARTLVTVALIGIGLALLAIFSAYERVFAAMFIAAAVSLLVLLYGVGAFVQWLAGRLPKPKLPLPRLALANLHRPGAQTSRLVVALGLGLSLFTMLAVIETNLSGQMASNIPKKAPSFFALDIPQTEVNRFRAIVERAAPGSDIITVPALRGSVVSVKGQRVTEMKEIPPDAWILRGDRGLTYAEAVPNGNTLVRGTWWPKNYTGPPLVSVDIRAGEALGLKLGDELTVSVLGVEVPAKIANFREIDWDSMGLNFALIFSPNALAEAPHSYLATISVPDTAGSAREAQLNRDVARAFPSISLVRVKEVIASVSTLLGQLSSAVRAAGSVAIFAGIAVLIGAIAAAQQTRIYDSVLLKLLGATRRQILGGQFVEYAALALIIAGISLAVGTAGGWYVATQLLTLEWAPSWRVVLTTLGVGTLTTLGLGLLGSIPALGARPAQALREL
jgi:putative ABC transport system permease protein